ncbi:MAG: TIGR02147 family protein, partial [Bdellovibrionota bacterium]
MELSSDTSLRLPPDILRYGEYRAFLADFYAYKKSQRSGFSYRLFAAKAKLKSPNYLQLVMQGKRNLS